MRNHPCHSVAVCLLAALGMVGSAWGANVAVLSNQYASECAADLGAHLPGHTFTAVDVSSMTPTLASLAPYNVVLLFEDGTFSNSANVGPVVAQFAQTGRGVVLGTFYNQDRSDAGGNGWGALETLDPCTTDGQGTTYDPNTLDPASIVPHPLTAGVATLTSSGYSAGNQAKPGTTVLALWTNLNALGNPDPLISYRVTGPALVIDISIAPHYGYLMSVGNGSFSGDFYKIWDNAFTFAASGASAQQGIPAASPWGLAALALMIALAGAALLVMRRA